jgi:multiple sugar transport system substrate-binding protein
MSPDVSPRRRIRWSGRLLLAGGLAATLAATACSGSAPGGAASPGTETFTGTGPATLWVRAADQGLDKALVDAWNAANPSRKITLVSIPDAQYVQKYLQGVRSGDVPDIAVVDIANATTLVGQGVLTDLTTHVDALDFKSALAPAALSVSSASGRVYGVPHQLDVSVLFYNKTLFSRAGIQNPPKTLAELTADAKAVRALGGDNYGFYFGGNCAGCNAYTTLPFVWASGGDVMNADGTKATLDDPAVAATMNALHQMWQDQSMPASAKDENGATWLTSFQSGTIGMLPLGSFGVAVFGAQQGLDFGVAPIPGANGGTGAFLGGDIVGISKGAKNAATAWDFITWSLQQAQQVDIVAKSGALVVRSDVIDNQYTKADPRLSAANEQIKTAKVPVTAKYNQLFIDSASPFLQLIRQWVFDGDQQGALTQARSGFDSQLAS